MMEEDSIEEGNWVTLFKSKQMADTLWRAIDEEGFGHPVLTPWVMQDFGGGVWKFERNT